MTGTSSVDRYVRLALGVVPLAAAATLGFVSTPVHAAEPATADQLVEVVVTARYREENLQSTPLAISAFSAEELEARSLVNVSDLGGTIPNAFIRQSASNFGPTQTIGLRGLIQGDFSYAFEPAVGIYIDDVYHGTLTGSTMDLLDLDRVEVLRGPQGTLFGINTMGGAVRLISKKPQGDGSGWIEATYGSRRRLDVKAMGDFSLIDNLLYARVSGLSRRQDGYGNHLDFTCEMIRRGTPTLAGLGDGLGAGPSTGNPPVQGQPVAVPVGSTADNNFSFPRTIDPQEGNDCSLGKQGGSQSQGGRVQLRYLASEALEINVSGDYSTQTADPPVETMLVRRNETVYDPGTVFPRYGIRVDQRFVTGDPYSSYATYGDAIAGTSYDPYTHLRAWGVSGTADYSFTEKTHLKLISSYRTYETTWVNDSDLTPFELVQTNYLQSHRAFQLEGQLTGLLLDDRLDWTVGAFYYDSDSRAYNTANFPTFGLKFTADDLFTTKNTSGFVHASYKLTDKLAVSGGLRYSNEDKTNWFRHFGQFVLPAPLAFGGDHVSYKAGIDFQATDNLFFYGSVSDGFTSAGITPRIFSQEQLQPLTGEEVVNYELGAKVEMFDKKVRINSAVFFMDYKSRLVLTTARECALTGSADPGPPIFGLAPSAPCPPGTPSGDLPVTPPPAAPLSRNGTTWFYYSVAPGEVKGFETEISAFPIENLVLNASAGFNQFKGDEENPLSTTYRNSGALLQPKWNVSAGAQYALHFGNGAKITPRLDYYYQSYRTNGAANLPQRDPDDINPGYGIYNARIAYDPPSGDWQLALSVLNLTDHFYWQQLGSATSRVPGSPLASGAPSVGRVGTPSRPREWAVTFRKNFNGLN